MLLVVYTHNITDIVIAVVILHLVITKLLLLVIFSGIEVPGKTPSSTGSGMRSGKRRHEEAGPSD